MEAHEHHWVIWAFGIVAAIMTKMWIWFFYHLLKGKHCAQEEVLSKREFNLQHATVVNAIKEMKGLVTLTHCDDTQQRIIEQLNHGHMVLLQEIKNVHTQIKISQNVADSQRIELFKELKEIKKGMK